MSTLFPQLEGLIPFKMTDDERKFMEKFAKDPSQRLAPATGPTSAAGKEAAAAAASRRAAARSTKTLFDNPAVKKAVGGVPYFGKLLTLGLAGNQLASGGPASLSDVFDTGLVDLSGARKFLAAPQLPNIAQGLQNDLTAVSNFFKSGAERRVDEMLASVPAVAPTKVQAPTPAPTPVVQQAPPLPTNPSELSLFTGGPGAQLYKGTGPNGEPVYSDQPGPGLQPATLQPGSPGGVTVFDENGNPTTAAIQFPGGNLVNLSGNAQTDFSGLKGLPTRIGFDGVERIDTRGPADRGSIVDRANRVTGNFSENIRDLLTSRQSQTAAFRAQAAAAGPGEPSTRRQRANLDVLTKMQQAGVRAAGGAEAFATPEGRKVARNVVISLAEMAGMDPESTADQLLGPQPRVVPTEDHIRQARAKLNNATITQADGTTVPFVDLSNEEKEKRLNYYAEQLANQ